MTGPSAPDVTVVVAVYNTMPYLARCLDSLSAQSLAPGRIEVVVVDNDSTDGSDQEIDRFVRRNPDTFRSLHLPNSGGPAAPSNRGLEEATGRYVFFLGADDYLAPETLGRMVAMADRHGSDVVLCKMVPVGQRTVPRRVFTRTAKSIRLVGDGLPWALSNTKLFRRDLLEREKIRYNEDMPAFSDQPFVLEACLRARRISVLADRPYYYAVRRTDSSNITYSAPPELRLRCAEKLFDTTSRLTEPGPVRAGFHRRHFSVEVFQLFDGRFLRLRRDTQARLCAGVAVLVEAHGAGVLQQLDPLRRTTLELASRGQVEELCALVRRRTELLRAVALDWAPPDRSRVPALSVTLRAPAGERAENGLIVRRVPVLPPSGGRWPRSGQRWTVHPGAQPGDRDTALTADSLPLGRRWWRRGRPYRLLPQLDSEGQLSVVVEPVPLRAAARRARQLVTRGR